MTIEKTHIGIVITRDGPEKASRDGKYVVVGKNEFYHKDTGCRHFAENTRRRLLLETIEKIGSKL
jgi:hypothetical protein